MGKQFTVFEHCSLKQGECYKGVLFTESDLRLFEAFFRERDFPYYKLIRKGVRFCEYVGVLQLGSVTVEVLPKADKRRSIHSADEPTDEPVFWRQMLLDMLRVSGFIKLKAPSTANLSLRAHSILDLYIALFLEHCERLLHQGLIKKYRQNEGNTKALKGNLMFGKHLQHNLTHQERFYVKHTVYSVENLLNEILYKCLKLIRRINNNPSLCSRVEVLLLNFPEQRSRSVNEALFSKITFNRKTESYRESIGIAKILLLNFHPDVTNGSEDVLALMFNMNLLWEKFIFRSLVKYSPPYCKIIYQSKKLFWKKEDGCSVKMIPDIVVDAGEKGCVVLDTKWKNIGTSSPSPEDLRQMYVYSRFHQKAKTALLYPGNRFGFVSGNFLHEDLEERESSVCGLFSIEVQKNVEEWQRDIARNVFASELFD